LLTGADDGGVQCWEDDVSVPFISFEEEKLSGFFDNGWEAYDAVRLR
jgi:hypothetical protein